MKDLLASMRSPTEDGVGSTEYNSDSSSTEYRCGSPELYLRPTENPKTHTGDPVGPCRVGSKARGRYTWPVLGKCPDETQKGRERGGGRVSPGTRYRIISLILQSPTDPQVTRFSGSTLFSNGGGFSGLGVATALSWSNGSIVWLCR